MSVAKHVREALGSSSMIRKMFEEGARLRRLHGADAVFDFSIGNPDLEPPAAFHSALLELATEDAAGSHGYMPNAGYDGAREAMARKASREHGVRLDGSHIVMSVGAAGALNVIMKSALNPGDEVIVSRPYFMEYRQYAANHGGRLVEVAARADFNLDVDAVRDALTDRTAAVLINSPHNPTGRIYPASTIADLSAVLSRHGERTGRYPYLVADEPYRELAYDGAVVPPVLSAYPHSIAATSFSKSLSLPGERIGYIAVAPDIGEKDTLVNALVYATRVLGFVNAPALMQRCVERLADEKAAVGVYAARRAAFKEVLDGAGLSYAEPEGAFYLFCKAPNGDDAAFIEALKKRLILGVPGAAFGSRGWVRFAYCVSESVIRASASAFKAAVRDC